MPPDRYARHRLVRRFHRPGSLGVGRSLSGSRSASGLLTWGSDETFEQPRIARPCFEQDAARDPTGGIAEGERDDHDIIQGTDHGEELGNQVDGRDDPYHRGKDGKLRSTRHARVIAQATDHGDAGREESGQLLHQSRRESNGKHDEHRPRHEQTSEGDKNALHSVTVVGRLLNVKLTHYLAAAGDGQRDAPYSLRRSTH